MRDERLTTEYLCYLMNRAGLEADGDYGYLRLCETLHEIDFLPQTDMDENRCEECRDLRVDFANTEYGAEGLEVVSVIDILDDELCESGTMFELLVVLAEKMAFETSDSEYEASTRKWLIEMLLNCGLDKNLLNSDFEVEGCEEAVKAAMDVVIFRKTGWDGEGGLFPLAYPQYDQRRAELLIQLNNYLEENYDIC